MTSKLHLSADGWVNKKGSSNRNLNNIESGTDSDFSCNKRIRSDDVLSANESIFGKFAPSNVSLVKVYEEFRTRKNSKLSAQLPVSRFEYFKTKVYTFFKNLFSPTTNSNTIRIFGSEVEVELERKRSFETSFIIHPLSRFKYTWDLFMLLILSLNIFVIPLDIAFFGSKTFIPFHVCSDTICFFDIIINFRTGFHLYSDKFQLNGKIIAKSYLKSWFTIDLLSSIPLDHIVTAIYNLQPRTIGASTIKTTTRALKIFKITKLVNMLKLLRFLRLGRMITLYGDAYQVTVSIMRYIKLVCCMLLLSHWNGCLHYFISMLEDFPEGCWVRMYKIIDEPWYIKYGWSLFKTLSHMLCIGYGRFMPMLLSEAYVTLFTMITGATFYALIITNAVASRVNSCGAKTLYNEKVKETEEYLSNRDVPRTMRERMDQFFSQKYPGGKYVSENDVLNEISMPIRKKILAHNHEFLIENLSFLRDAPKEAVFKLFSKATSTHYMPEEIVMKEGLLGRELFFVCSGELVITVNQQIVEIITGGACVGLVATLTGQRRLYSVTALRTCEILVLPREELQVLVAEYSKLDSLLQQFATGQLTRFHENVQKNNIDTENMTESSDSFVTPLNFYDVFLESMESLASHKYRSAKRSSSTAIQTVELDRLISDVNFVHSGSTCMHPHFEYSDDEHEHECMQDKLEV